MSRQEIKVVFIYSEFIVLMMNILEVFSLFSIVQFPNDECATNDINVKTGVCTTSTECTDNSGVESGTCASGFGGKIQFSRWTDGWSID